MLTNPTRLPERNRLHKGMYIEGFPFNGHLELGMNLRNWPEFPDITMPCREAPEWEDTLNCYGVCDSPEQFHSRFNKALEDDPRSLVVMFTHVGKDPSNKGQGGGWRWRKWGPYIGDGQPTTEYLDDEPDFNDGIWTYHIYEYPAPR